MTLSILPTRIDIPTETIAVVFLTHAEQEAIRAQYAEILDRVPAPKYQVAKALRMLADEIERTIPEGEA